MKFEAFSKESQFKALTTAVQHCEMCPRMHGRVRVLSALNGSVQSRVLFVAEAPGRLGADRTAIPLYGDKAGDNFEKLLSTIGWSRDSVFITNAVLCNPRAENGNNATPTTREIANCSHYLHATLNLIRPDVVVTLGAAALRAVGGIQPHSFTLRDHVRQLVDWSDRKLFIAYHPGQRAMIHRSFANQTGDFYELAKWIDPVEGLKTRRRRPPRVSAKDQITLRKLLDVIGLVTSMVGELSKFKLVKLLYLADLAASQRLGQTITNCVYLRQVDGPWPPRIDDALRLMRGNEIDIVYRRKIPYVLQGPNPSVVECLKEPELDLLKDIVHKYAHLSNSKIKSAAYHTEPMKSALANEQTGDSRLNKLVLK